MFPDINYGFDINIYVREEAFNFLNVIKKY